MTKIVKIKQSDIVKIVKNIVAEQTNFDDFDTQKTPEELPNDIEDVDITEPIVPEFLIGKDENGQIAVTNTKTGEIIRK